MKTLRTTRLSGHRASVVGWAVTLMLLSGPASADPGQPTPTTRAPQVIAHRGGAMNRPENTIPAFRHAMALGVEILEFDMEMTADGQIVVYHDANINPAFCTPRADAVVTPGPIRGLSLAQTRQFDCGSGVRPSYAGKAHVAVPGAGIPSLDEMLTAVAGGDAMLFAETKIPKPAPGLADIDPLRFATMLDAAVRRHGLEERLILQSFDFRTIDALHAINPRIRTCLLGAPKLTSDYLALLREHHATCIVLGAKNVDRDGVAQLQKAGTLVFSDVVDTPAEWKTYADLGVDAIFTNDPASLIGLLRQWNLRK
jgi:glycerophosphoryl diester phosphodiesterase